MDTNIYLIWGGFEMTLYNNTHVTFIFGLYGELTHLGRVTHICASQLTIIGSDNGL